MVDHMVDLSADLTDDWTAMKMVDLMALMKAVMMVGSMDL